MNTKWLWKYLKYYFHDVWITEYCPFCGWKKRNFYKPKRQMCLKCGANLVEKGG